MKRTTRFHRRLVAAATVAALVGAQAALAGPAVPEAPEDLRVQEGNKVFLVADAIGLQIYRCTAVGAAWSFVGPRADLFDEDGKLVATHFGGPTWKARDGSFVKAALERRVTVDSSAIDWFLLRATQKGAGPDGDRLAATTFIQRLDTTGGLAPAAATCDADSLGDVVEVPYTAVYAFWKASGQ